MKRVRPCKSKIMAMAGVQRTWRAVWPIAAASFTGLVAWFVSVGMLLESQPNLSFGVVLFDLACGVIAVVASGFRHRAPVTVALIATLLSIVSTAACGALVLTTMSLATRRRARELVPVVFVGLMSSIAVELIPQLRPLVLGGASGQPLETLAISALGYAVLVVAGVAIGSRRAEVGGLRREAAILREQAQSVSDQARLAERSRIAAELHDELGHRLSVIAVHTAALDFRDDLSPDQRKVSVTAIREAANAAMADLRRTLAMLADDPADDPSPLLSERLNQLFAQTQTAGYPLTAEVDAAIMNDQAPRPELHRHLVRITQECLTNAIRHAPGQPIDLHITGGLKSPVRIVVRNLLPVHPTPSQGSGMGIPGIAERVRLVGGELTVHPDENGYFTVEAVLP